MILEWTMSDDLVAVVDEAREGLGLSRALFVQFCIEAVAEKRMIPAALLEEAIQTVEAVQADLRAGAARAGVIARLDDAITILAAAEDLEYAESVLG